ncbi:MAG: cation:proton antiporter [Lentisphaeria bacterium]|nr:cation:proton antiporter [Lentisphaeria bacterium]
MAKEIAVLVLQIGVILFAARIFGKIAKKIKIPSVLGELVAGIVIGPYMLGHIGIDLHGFENGLFPLVEGAPLPVSGSLYAIATIGSIILLFLSGLETDLNQFFRYSIAGTLVGFGGAIVSFLFGDWMGMWMFETGFMDARCLFLGILCTATSVGITARILSEKKSIDSPEGTTILAAAVIDDVLGIIALAIVLGIVGASGVQGGSVDWGHIGGIAVKSFGIWLGITAVGLALAHKIAQVLKWFPPSGTFSILAFGLALILAGLFEQAGLAMIVGAYVMGLSLSKTDIAFSIQRNLEGIYDFLVPIFFVVMGMLVDVRVFQDMEVLKFGLIYSVLAIAAKVIGCALPALFMNFNMLGSLRIGMGMIPRGEVALIIAGIGSTTMMVVNGKEVPVIDPKLFGIAIIMTLITTIAAPPLLAAVLSIKKKGVIKEVVDKTSIHIVYDLPSEIIKDLVKDLMLENFSQEGFRHEPLGREGGVSRFRKDATTFTLTVENNRFDFESGEKEAMLIRTVMYETFVEIHKVIGDLKDFALPKQGEFSGEKAALEKIGKAPTKVNRVIQENAIIMDLQAEDHEEAILELIAKLSENCNALKDVALCREDVLKREAIISTCIPGGVALPHAKTEGAERLIAAVGISRKGCKTASNPQEKVHIYVLSLCPKTSAQPYLQFVAHVAKILARKENVEAILQAESAERVLEIFQEKYS